MAFEHLKGAFDKVATTEPPTPTLPQLLDLVRENFEEDGHIEVIGANDLDPTHALFKSTTGYRLDLKDNGDGTFSINYNADKNFNQNPPEKTMEALARFFVRHRGTGPAVADRKRTPDYGPA